MRSQFQFRRPSRRTMIIGTVVLGSLFIYGLTQIHYQCDWTGFGDCDFVKESSDEDYRPEKTLWDWLELLVIPVVLAVGGYIFNRVDKQAELDRTEQQARTERDLAQDAQREAALQTYFDRMTELLLSQELHTSQPEDQVSRVARARTLAALRELDAVRKGSVIRFLAELQLIRWPKRVIYIGEADLNGAYLQGAKLGPIDLPETEMRNVDLSFADFEKSNLSKADLRHANLREAVLYQSLANLADFRHAHLQGSGLSGSEIRGAKFNYADLTGAFLAEAILDGSDLSNAIMVRTALEKADLTNAILTNAILDGSNLIQAVVTPEQLAQAKSLKGATMPDGSIHP